MIRPFARLWQKIEDAGLARQRETVRRHERTLALRPWVKDHAALDALIARSGYAELAGDLRRSALPCIYFLDAGDATDSTPGVTRFGGLPDLPSGVDWPRAPGGGPLSFLAQIALSDVAGGGATPLPSSGLLSFFAGEWQIMDGSIPVSVFHHPVDVLLERRERPVAIDAFDCPHTAKLHPVAARCAPGLTFPEYDFEWKGRLEEEAPGGADFDSLEDGMRPPFPNLGQLLGHGPWIGDDLRAEVFFREIGRTGKEPLLIWQSWDDWEGAKAMASELANGTIYRPWSSDDDTHMRWILDHSAEVTAGIARWQFLFAVESGIATDLWINDANAIYFFIPAEDLISADFSRVAAVTTQS